MNDHHSNNSFDKQQFGRADNSRISWVSAAKFVAILAVVTDHCNGILYENQRWAWLSCFSVTVFIFLSGITSYGSNERHAGEPWGKEFLRRAKGVLLPYALATFLYQIAADRFWDWNAYARQLLQFNAAGPFYFVAFYLQLLAVGPLLYQIILWCDRRKFKTPFHILAFLSLAAIAVACIHRTHVLDMSGARYLFGGSYLFVYYLGMLFASRGIRFHSIKAEVASSAAALVYTVAWHTFMFSDQLSLDAKFAIHGYALLGRGFNPPGISFCLYGFGIVWLLFSLFSLMEDLRSRFAHRILEAIAWLGRYSLYIFLYHLLLLNYFLPHLGIDSLKIRIVVYLPVVIGVPILGKLLYDRIKRGLYFSAPNPQDRGA